MKKPIKAAELEGDSLKDYVKKIQREVERDLKDEVNELDWDMYNDKVYLSVEFKDGTPSTFGFESWRFTGEPAYFDYDVDIILDSIHKFMKNNHINGKEPDRYNYIKSKSVMDSDGFYTDYTMYYDNEEEMYVFIFGDNELYTPENTESDVECETREEAEEWFDNYHGFDEEEDWRDDDSGWYESEENVESGCHPETSTEVTTSFDPVEDMDASDVIGKLNTGDKFKNRDGVVVEIIEPTKNGLIQFQIGDQVKMGSEKSVQKLLYKNNYMRIVETSQEFVDMGTGLEYWYFTTHGVQPGSVPKGLNIIQIIDAPEGSYFLTDRVITTKALQEYDIKERVPKNVEASSVPEGRYWEPGWEDANNDEDAPYIYITADSWDEFIQEIEEETGLKLDSAYKRRHRGDDYFEFVDDLGNTFSATYTQYNDGSFEFRGESLKTL